MEGDWHLSEDVDEFFETVAEYERVPGDPESEPYEYVRLEAPSDGLNDPVGVEVFLGRGGAEVWHRTNVDYRPVFDVIDRQYPPQVEDEIWVGDSESFEPWSIREGMDEDIHTFQFYQNHRDPVFDLEWTDFSHNSKDGDPTPFGFKISCYDHFGLSMDRETSQPVDDFLPVMLRTDSPVSSRAAIIQDLSRLLDYGHSSQSGVPLAMYFGEKEYGAVVQGAAERYDPHR
ncbi:MAG: hypothetical protein ABEJ07_02205 [Candidatus Nanohaloarchaea archaeon]